MGKTNIRKPVVAGQFYPKEKQELLDTIKSFIPKAVPKINAIGCILPHAGYVYSGRVAVEAAARINLKNKIILLGPNHTGRGENFSIMTAGSWATPLGEIKIDEQLAKELLKNSKCLKEDSLAHEGEHSLEVELPILQYFNNNFTIVPIAVMSLDVPTLKKIGQEIAATIKNLKLKDSVTLIASSDMTHYEPQAQAKDKDSQAIKAILDLNADELARKVSALNISMCGFAPTVILISAAKDLGAKQAELIKYQTSGDVSGDKSSVVGYASITIY